MSNKQNGKHEKENIKKEASPANFGEEKETMTSEPESVSNEEKDHTSAMENLQQDLDSQKEKYLRLFAEFENYKKRTAKEVFDIRQTAGVNIISALLEVLDDMDRAEEQIQQNNNNAHGLEGVQLIFNKFRKILEQQGLHPIETLYSDFDVEKDEAISEMPVEDEKLRGKVVAEVQKGYMLNDKLIRFAKVVVGK